MLGFKAFALLLASSLAVAVPVTPDTAPSVHGTGLKDLTVGLAGTDHNVPRSPFLEGLLDTIGVGKLAGSAERRDGVPALDTSGLLGVATGGADVNGIKLPTSASGVTGALPGRRDAPATPEVDTSAVDGAPSPPETKVDHPHASTLPEIFQVAIVRLTPIIARLKASVSLKADIDVDVVVVILNEIIVVLGDVVVEIQFIIDHPVPVVLGLAGSVVSLPEVAFAIASLIWLVATGLYLVVLAVATVSVTASATINPLIVQIGDLLAHILVLVLALVDGLLPFLAAALAPVVQLLWYLHLGQIAAVVGISSPN